MDARDARRHQLPRHPATGPSYQLARTGPTDELFQSSDQSLYTAQVNYSVTTLTSYGWTKRSAMAEIRKCPI